MCFFLTVAVPAKQVKRIGEVFARGFGTHATQNASVSAALPVGYKARLVTSGMCSCGLYAPPRVAAESDPSARLRSKYEKLGWTEAKIQRSLKQNVASTSQQHPPVPGLRDDVADRLNALCRAAGSVAFLVHWYNGDLESEVPTSASG
jgi:hypothetical protein